MIEHYVYSLSIAESVFYIGVSVNPAKRLYQHLRTGYCVWQSTLLSINDIKDVSINILDIVRTKSSRTCKACHKIEQRRINEYLQAGHKLINQLITPMPLTKSQRHTAYIIMREELRRGESTGEVVWRIWYGSVDYEELIELDKRVMLYPSMWISHATRLRILDEYIKETY